MPDNKPRVDIDTIIVCDAQKNPIDNVPGDKKSFEVTFPSPQNSSGDLHLKVSCDISPDESAEVKFVLTINKPDDYVLTPGNDGTSAQYTRQVTATDKEVFLKFSLGNKKPVGSLLQAVLLLTAKRTVVGSAKGSTGNVSIIPK